ncbi:MAG: threonine/serine exporter family protein [Xanthomonadales bacterium]|nr:threonine/serine exporter family protein [Xanthomonadales bacterium]
MTSLARDLHEAGTTAPRLEAALSGVATKLSLTAQVFSAPTVIMLSLRDVDAPAGSPAHSELLRVEPNDVNLGRLRAVDDIAERLVRGEMAPLAAHAALAETRVPQSRDWARAQTVLGFPLASAAVSGLLRAQPAEIAAATLIGLMIGLLALAAERHPRLGENLSVVAAFLAAFGAAAFSAVVAPVAFKVVLVTSLIVLMPGLSLTLAMAELGMRHLMAGSARLAGGMVTLLELAFGALAGSKAADVLGWGASLAPETVLSASWLAWVALPVAGVAFALLFRARLSDWPAVLFAAFLAYGVSQLAALFLGAELGLFISAMVLALSANAYARYFNRPGALLRVPGLILLVPGSVGFRSLNFIFEKDISLGLDAAFSLIVLLAALVAGLLLGNGLLPARRLNA